VTATTGCQWCHDGAGGGECRNRDTQACEAPNDQSASTCEDVPTTTITTTSGTDETTTTATTATVNSDGASNPIVDDGSIDPALMWGLIGGGICLFLLLLLLCIVLLVRRRRRKDEPKDYDNVDLTVVNGESSPNSKDSAAAYLGEDELDSVGPDEKEPAIYQSTSALVKPEPAAASSGIIYSAFKETNASMPPPKSSDLDDDESV